MSGLILGRDVPMVNHAIIPTMTAPAAMRPNRIAFEFNGAEEIPVAMVDCDDGVGRSAALC